MAKSATVSAMVAQWNRIAVRSIPLKAPRNRPGPSPVFGFTAFGSIVTPSSGVKITATNQEMISEEAITANSVKVYSPAELVLSPIGTKPATVNKVPVSIGNAVEV
jgi:hypothetical protein